MTAGRPPWEIFGAETPEAQAADPAPARPLRSRSPGFVPDVPAWAAPVKTDAATAVPPREQPAAAEPPWPGSPEHGSSGHGPPEQGPRAGTPVVGLPARLTAMARLIQIAAPRAADGGFSHHLLRDAENLVDRAGERLRLSADHTVVVLAGGTGSGKSALFNRLAGADLSAVGVTRPVTRDAHACVWGGSGSGALLEWLGVPRRYRYTRGSALDGGEASLNGLVLLDLPDHDSVVGGSSDQVDRLIGMADLMVWVLDPQKYADAAVHRRYLVPLAGHSEVIAVVLNQSDLLSGEETEDCVGDLRRLLDSEGLHDAALLVTSAETGSGMDQLRTLLGQTVADRKVTAARISADLDGIAAEFEPHTAGSAQGSSPAGCGSAEPEADAGGAPAGQERAVADPVPLGLVRQLVAAFSRAVGVSAVADALQSARELRAVDYVGWPIAWLAERLTGRDPVRKVRLGRLWAEVKSMTSVPTGAQQADIDNALTKLADQIGPPLPKPWSQTTRFAVRSRANLIPSALGAAMSESLPDESKIVTWWRMVGVLQGLLLGCIIVSLAWLVALLAFGVFHAAGNVPRLFGDASLLPWIIVMIAAFLLLGWLTAWACMRLVRACAERERQEVQDAMSAKIGDVARDMVVVPVEQELAEYLRFRDEFRVAAGT